MRFPSIYELATTHVKSISIDATLQDAVDLMIGTDHRNIIVVSHSDYYLLSVHDVICVERRSVTLDHRLSELDLPKLPTVDKNANILEALDHLQDKSEIIVLLNSAGSFFGIVTHSDIISSIDPDTLMDNYRLCDFVKSNKYSRWVGKYEKTADVLNDMRRHQHDSAIIIENQKPIGIVTTKDILRLVQEKEDLTLDIEKHMTRPVVTIEHDRTINQAMAFMKSKHFKRIVTVDQDGKLVGIITQKELISITYSRWVHMMKEYQEELSQINQMLEKKNQKYEKIAGTDQLTGLYNRMKFIELYVSQYNVMTQRHNAMSLIIIDLDHFKKINDTYGHNSGDKVLKQVSNILLRELRNVDILCRWGGEEFLALLPTADVDQALKIADHIRQKVSELKIDDLPQITASFGVTQIIEGDQLEDAINRADQALYSAKAAGRNKVLKA